MNFFTWRGKHDEILTILHQKHLSLLADTEKRTRLKYIMFKAMYCWVFLESKRRPQRAVWCIHEGTRPQPDGDNLYQPGLV